MYFGSFSLSTLVSAILSELVVCFSPSSLVAFPPAFSGSVLHASCVMTQVRLSATGWGSSRNSRCSCSTSRLLQRPARRPVFVLQAPPAGCLTLRAAGGRRRKIPPQFQLATHLASCENERESLDVLSWTWKNGRMRGAAVKATRVHFGSWRRAGGPSAN